MKAYFYAVAALGLCIALLLQASLELPLAYSHTHTKFEGQERWEVAERKKETRNYSSTPTYVGKSNEESDRGREINVDLRITSVSRFLFLFTHSSCSFLPGLRAFSCDFFPFSFSLSLSFGIFDCHVPIGEKRNGEVAATAAAAEASFLAAAELTFRSAVAAVAIVAANNFFFAKQHWALETKNKKCCSFETIFNSVPVSLLP